MIRRFISVMSDGTVTRHEEPPTEMVRTGAVTIIEIAPSLVSVEARVHLIDETGDRYEEVL